MKSILSMIAVCAVVALAGCNNSNKTASMGAVGDKKACSAECSATCKDKSGTSMGAVGEKKDGCCADKAKACPVSGKNETVSPGAVGEKKSGCCASKAETVSPGAVSDAPKKSGCCASKAETVSPGAVSDAPKKSGCSASKSSCGSK